MNSPKENVAVKAEKAAPKTNPAMELMNRIGVVSEKDKINIQRQEVLTMEANCREAFLGLVKFGQLLRHEKVIAATEYHEQLVPLAQDFRVKAEELGASLKAIRKQTQDINEDIDKRNKALSVDYTLLISDVVFMYNEWLVKLTEEVLPVAGDISDILLKIDSELESAIAETGVTSTAEEVKDETNC